MCMGRFRHRFSRYVAAARVGTALAVVGCNTRDRLTFPNPGPPGSGPLTVIDRPLQDTTVSAGPDFLVTGYSRDPQGLALDTVYLQTDGGVTTFQPIVGSGDSVRFGMPLTTLRQSGVVITVRVFATNSAGVRGDTALRRVTVQ